VSRLKTARVPPAFEEEFIEAEELVARYFENRRHDPTRGTIEIAGERYVLMRAASLSVEFFDLVEKLHGPDREPEARAFARNILFDLAHAIGKSDAKNFHQKMNLLDPMARLSAGPIHFAHAGWAFVDIDGSSRPEPGPEYRLLYDHPYAFESDAWVRAGRSADFPVCIMNAGYSSGWCEESFDMPLVATEVLCRAKGDDCCRFIMAPPDQIERRVEEYIADAPNLASRMRSYEIPDFFARKKLRRDMEERERLLTRLQNTQRLESLGRLAGGVAHDFNNLLGVIMGYSSIMQGRVGEDDPMHSMLAEITEASQLAAHLTRQLLTFSRAQVLAKRRIDLNEVVSDVAGMLKRLVGDDVVVRHTLDARAAIIEADMGQLEQMLMNLAVNARDAMPDGGSLRIETKLIGDDEPTAVKLSVSDTGVGMSEETRSKIFEPFFSAKPGGEGTGLGLSTVYGIVTQAGGTISVDSAVSFGARFDIVWPLAEGDGEVDAPAPESQPPSLRPGVRVETVLLAEDRIGFRALMANLLGDSGYDVLVAHDTGDAMRIAKNHPSQIHVLVTDVIMPAMNGRELAERVLVDRPNIKVLFMSGFANDPGLVEQAVDGENRARAGGPRSGFIAKPFTPRELERALRRLLDDT
jgi:two-component system cell cycle sensor histidine kinase/response regulator CckA